MMYSTVMTAQSKTKLNGVICVLCAVVSVGLNVLLLPYWGLNAAVFVNFLVFFINYALCRHFADLQISFGYCLVPFVLFVAVNAVFVYLWHPSIIFDIISKVVVLIVFSWIVLKVLNIRLDFLLEIIPFRSKTK